MNKTIKLGLCAVLTALPVQYALAEAYVGVAAGYGMTTIEKDIQYNSTDTESSDRYNSIRAQLLLGYNIRNFRRDVLLDEGASSSDFFFAVEGALTYATDDVQITTNNWFLDQDASVREKMRYQADLFLLAKYVIQPSTTVFIGPGVTVSKLEVETVTQTAGNLGVTGSDTTNVSGWGVKAGMEVEICDGVNLVAAYQYSDYESVSFSGREPFTGDNVTAKYSPMISAFTVGVVIH